MGFLFSVMGVRALGVSQRPFVGFAGSVGAEYEFWVCGIGSRGFVFRGTRSDVFLGFLCVVTLIAPRELSF